MSTPARRSKPRISAGDAGRKALFAGACCRAFEAAFSKASRFLCAVTTQARPLFIVVQGLTACCVCSATKDMITVLSEPIRMSLDDCLEYVADDELIEVSGPHHYRPTYPLNMLSVTVPPTLFVHTCAARAGTI